MMGKIQEWGGLLREETNRHDTQISVGYTFDTEQTGESNELSMLFMGRNWYKGPVDKLATSILVDSFNDEEFRFFH